MSSSSSSSSYPLLNLILIIIISITSLFVFQSGFLLKRVQLHEKSKCEDVSLDSSSCWLTPQYNRVILIIIDALRYDFLSSQSINNSSSPYIGQMPYTRDLVHKGGFLCKSLADPPTTTLQRLKALGTGGLPTFIDASDNFNSDAAIEEDNILAQLVSSGRNATLLGDDTWLSLYPTAFHRSFAKESFDIHDLHTVDNYILDHIWDELSRNDWSLLIGHFLGVDHAGHKYGPFHIEMGAKLRQMDRVIKDIVSTMKSGDLLVVMGDHGMTQTGDHGGDSNDEVGAAFLAYSPGVHFTASSNPIQQIDIVPTLSLLLDLPIPFSSLGSPIENLFNDKKTATMAVHITAMQVERFASTYSRSQGGLSLNLPEEVPESLDEQRLLLLRLQSSLRSQWTQFSLPLMRISLASFIDIILSLFIKPTVPSLIVRHSYLLLLLSLLLSPSPESSIGLSILTLSLPLSILYSLSHIIMNIISYSSSIPLSIHSILPYILLFLSYLIPFSNSFIINEASIYRYFLSSILLLSFISSIKSSIQSSSSSNRRYFSLNHLSSLPSLILSLLCLRIQPLFHRCREEERDCLQYPSSLPYSSLPFDIRIHRFIYSFIASIVLYYLSRISSQSKQLPSLLSLSNSLSPLIIILIQLHFSSSLLPDSISLQYIVHFKIIAQLVYLLSLISILLILFSSKSPLILQPLLISISFPLYLILGEGIAPSFVALLILIYRIPSLIDRSHTVPFLSLLLPYSFYLLGHSPTLSTIPWHAAFVGLAGSSAPRWLAAILVFSHLYAHCILLLPSLPLLLQSKSTNQYRLMIAFMIGRTFFSSLSVMELRRHLMVWKIFAPHWIFSSLSVLVVLLFILLSISLNRRFSVHKV